MMRTHRSGHQPHRLLNALAPRTCGATVAALVAVVVAPAPVHAAPSPSAEPVGGYTAYQTESYVDCEQHEHQTCSAAASSTEVGAFDVSATVHNQNLQPVTLHSQRLRALGVATAGRTYAFTRGVQQAEVTVRLRVDEARASHERLVPAYGGLVMMSLRFGVHVACPDGGCSGGGSKGELERTMDPDTTIALDNGDYVYRFTLTGEHGGPIMRGTTFTVTPGAACGVDTSHTSGKAACRVAVSVVDVQVA